MFENGTHARVDRLVALFFLYLAVFFSITRVTFRSLAIMDSYCQVSFLSPSSSPRDPAL